MSVISTYLGPFSLEISTPHQMGIHGANFTMCILHMFSEKKSLPRLWEAVKSVVVADFQWVLVTDGIRIFEKWPNHFKSLRNSDVTWQLMFFRFWIFLNFLYPQTHGIHGGLVYLDLHLHTFALKKSTIYGSVNIPFVPWMAMGKIPFTNIIPLKGDYSSKLSPHLAYGCISPRRLVKEAR